MGAIVFEQLRIPVINEILRRGRSKYRSVRAVAGWVKSAVFGKSFRLVRRDLGSEVSEFFLEAK